MKKFWHIALLIICTFVVSSCGDKDDDDYLEVDEAWKTQNIEFFENLMRDPSFEKLYSQSNAGFILYKVLKEGKSKEQIFYTSKVSLHYKGSFINGDVFDDHTFEAGEPYTGTDGKGAPVNGFVDGFATALQYMHPGDVWEFYVPYQMGYGEKGRKGRPNILPYTTMHYVVEIVELMEQ